MPFKRSRPVRSSKPRGGGIRGPRVWSRSVATASERTYRVHSAAETDRLGRLIGQSSHGGEVMALYGELGTGKTTLVRGVATGLGAPPRSVTSPTFTLVHEYRGRLRLAHVDLYRVQTPAELHHIGLSEYLDGRTVVAVEWAEKAEGELPDDRLEVYLSHCGRTAREIRLKATGPSARTLLTRMLNRVRDAGAGT